MLFFQFYDALSRVGITKSIIAVNDAGRQRGRIVARIKAPLATLPEPLRGKLCLGNEACISIGALGCELVNHSRWGAEMRSAAGLSWELGLLG